MASADITRITTKVSALKPSEIWRFRDLFWALAWRDFRVRYAQTAIGLVWAFLQPLVTIVILYVVFGRFAQIDTGSIPHIVYTSCGVMGWTYFAYVMTNSGSSIISAQSMVKKVYFPRIIIPMSKAVVGLIDLVISGFILALLMIIFDAQLSSNVVFLPVFILMTIISALGIGILLSALSIRYRDIQYIIPFAVQIGLYITPTAYPAKFALERLPDWAQFLYFLNPMAGIVEGYRWCILGTDAPNALSFLSFGSMIVLLILAILYFRSVDGKIADYV